MDLRALVCLLLLLPCCTAAGRSNKGKEFIMMFMRNNKTPDNNTELMITSTSNTAANVNVTLPLYDPGFLQTLVVQRGQPVMVQLPLYIRAEYAAIEDKGVWVQSDQDITVIGVNKDSNTADAYLALPVNVLGMEYYVMTYIDETEIGIVATENATDVTVTLPGNPDATINVEFNGTTYQNNDSISVTLNRFETLQVYDSSNSADFTGAHVVANKPISVLGGNRRAHVPYWYGHSTDHLTEQIPPIETLGKTFYTYRTPGRELGDLLRIMAVEDSTFVSLGNGTNYTLNSVEFVELELDNETYLYIEADKGVLVGLFASSEGDNENKGDPAMTFLLPRPQWAADYTYSTLRTPDNTEFTNQIVVHIDQSKLDGLRLDNAVVTGVTWSPILGSSDIVVGVIDVGNGTHSLYHIDPTVTFSAICTGIAKFVSYAFAMGTRLATINSVCVSSSTVAGDLVDNDCDELIDEETLNGQDDDGDGLVDEDLATPARVDGNWGSWTSWSDCSVTCEAMGTQTRTRTCDNPAPANNGLDCDGNDMETNNCDMTAVSCAVDGNWGSWTSWSDCSVTCEAIGTQTRTRTCDNPAPANNGLDCDGNDMETNNCDMTAVGCPVDGNWSSWTSWSDCSVTCEAMGTQTRTRTCDNPAPANNGLDCDGNDKETNNCDMTAVGCPVDGNWGSWTSWSDCSVTCEAIGTQTRTRTCDNPAPANNGLDCDGNDKETNNCDMTAVGCPVDGNWGSWTSWSDCSVTCEAIGTQTRTRTCDNPAPANNGLDCDGNDKETNNCDMTAVGCPVDGSWTVWSSWDNCSVSCGIGVQVRNRSCTAPAPQNGGKDCRGATGEEHKCFLELVCPEPSASAAKTTAISVGASFAALAAITAILTSCVLFFVARRRKMKGTSSDDTARRNFPLKY